MSIVVKVDVESDRTSEAFKQARRDSYRRTRHALKVAGETVVLPAVKVRARRYAGRFADTIVIKTKPSSAYLTCKTAKQGRIIGWLNFGGTRTESIKPRRRKALAFNGDVVGRVDTPRSIPRRPAPRDRFMTPVVQERLGEFSDVLLRELMQGFDPLEHSP